MIAAPRATNGAHGPSPPAPTDHAPTRLFERKLRLAEQLQCRDLFAELASLDECIAAALLERATLDGEVRAAQRRLDELETLAALGVEGKNEAERKALRVKALHDDPFYAETTATLATKEASLAELDANLERWKRQAKRVELTIRYRTEVLGFLAG